MTVQLSKEGRMITRTGALLVLAVGAWTGGGLIAWSSHWHPFSHGAPFSHEHRFSRGHLHSRQEVRVVVPATTVRVRRAESRIEASVALPTHVHTPPRAVIRTAPARRGLR